MTAAAKNVPRETPSAWELEDLYPDDPAAAGRHLRLWKNGVIVGLVHYRTDWGKARQSGWQFCPPRTALGIGRQRRLRPSAAEALMDAAGLGTAEAFRLATAALKGRKRKNA